MFYLTIILENVIIEDFTGQSLLSSTTAKFGCFETTTSPVANSRVTQLEPTHSSLQVNTSH